jgi:hypothetical protein
LISVLVVGEVVAPRSGVRWAVVVTSCLSLALLATSMVWEIGALYRSHLPGPPGGRPVALGVHEAAPAAGPGVP